MRLYELFNKFNNDEILQEIIKLKKSMDCSYEESKLDYAFNENEFDDNYYKLGIENIKKVIPVLTNDVLCYCETMDYDIDDNTEKFKYYFQYNIFLLTENLIKEKNIDKLLEHRYDVSAIKWNELMGSYVFIDNIKENEFIKFVATYCMEMLFSGNSEEESEETQDYIEESLNQQIEEIENGTAVLYPFEELYDRLAEDAQKENNTDMVELFKELKKKQYAPEYEEYRQFRRNLTHKCVEYNKELYTKIIKDLIKKTFN